jgi:hypothetical protein
VPFAMKPSNRTANHSKTAALAYNWNLLFASVLCKDYNLRFSSALAR